MHRPNTAPSVRVTSMRNAGDAMETVMVLIAMSVAILTAGLLFAIVLPVMLLMPVTVPTGTTVTRRLPPRLRLRLRSRKGGMAQELERSAGPGAEADVGAGAVHTSCLRLRQRLRL